MQSHAIIQLEMHLMCEPPVKVHQLLSAVVIFLKNVRWQSNFFFILFCRFLNFIINSIKRQEKLLINYETEKLIGIVIHKNSY